MVKCVKLTFDVVTDIIKNLADHNKIITKLDKIHKMIRDCRLQILLII